MHISSLIIKAVGSAIEMPLTIMENQFFRMYRINLFFPGLPGVTITELHHIEEGWVVKVGDFQNLSREKALEIASSSTLCVACYLSGDVELWDVIMIADNEEDAVIYGKSMEQMTVYQIETGRLLWID